MSNHGDQARVLRALVLEDAIRRQMDTIVRRAAEAVQLLEPQGNEASGMKENQIRNALNVAEESQRVEVVTNFIRYQIGRNDKGQQWRYRGFGLRVIEDIEVGPVAEAADEVVKEVVNKLGERADQETLRREVNLELARYYLGYLNRAFYFCNKIEEDKDAYIPNPWAQVVQVKESSDV